MLVMGILTGAISAGSLSFLIRRGYPLRWSTGLSFFYLPAIMFVEALMYWTIRKRIVRRRDAWNHLILFSTAYVLNIIVRGVFNLFIVLHYRGMSDARTMNRILTWVFWGIVITAHVFFVRVLIKVFSGQPPVEEAVETGNLLDDVLD